MLKYKSLYSVIGDDKQLWKQFLTFLQCNEKITNQIKNMLFHQLL